MIKVISSTISLVQCSTYLSVGLQMKNATIRMYKNHYIHVPHYSQLYSSKLYGLLWLLRYPLFVGQDSMFNRLSVVSVGDVDPTRRVLEQCRITKLHADVASCRQFQIPRVIPSLPYKHKNKHTKTTLTTKHKQKPQTNTPPPKKNGGTSLTWKTFPINKHICAKL